MNQHPTNKITYIDYAIEPVNPQAHLFEVSLTVNIPSEQGHKLRLPAWIPGSYMIRDFARNIVSFNAESEGRMLEHRKLDKSTWQLAPSASEVRVVYQVYAWDLSVRAAHLDQTHGYFNGTSVFLEVVGFGGYPVRVDIKPPQLEEHRWRVATSLPELEAKRYGFGTYIAANYDELIDHPVEMADFTLATFDACGVPHDVVMVGKHRTDMQRLCRDLKTICEYQIRFFGEPAPMKRYVFMTYILGDGYGGLEHRASTSLHCKRSDLPLETDALDAVKPGYRTYLGLCSHEYFHTWNVKRIKPSQFLPYELAQESYTELLWVFEGFTSYFDDLVLVNSGVLSVEDYLDALAKVITRVWRGKGRFKQNVAESSFDAWSKFYKQDENAPNAIVSYYTKGSLIALCLDLFIREKTQNKKQLQDVMRYLWKEVALKGAGVEEKGLPSVIQAATGVDAQEFIKKTVYSTDDVAIESWLEKQGIQTTFVARKNQSDHGGYLKAPQEKASEKPDLGVDYKIHPLGVEVSVCHEGSCAQLAGLSAHDVIIAIDDLKIDAKSLDECIQAYAIGDTIKLHAFRRDELMLFHLKLEAAEKTTCRLCLHNEGLTVSGKHWLDQH